MAKPRTRDIPDLSGLATDKASFQVRVTPKARQNRLRLEGDTIRVWVTAAPEDGKANAAVQDLLAKSLGVARSRLSLLRGATSRDKVFVYSDPSSGAASRS